MTESVEQSSSTTVDKTLSQRGDRYGKFSDQAKIAQKLKKAISEALAERCKQLPYNQQEALDMICNKIGRIINGDNYYADSWHDIAGYATLVDAQLTGKDI